MPFAISTSSGFDETIIERQVVSDAVSPTRSTISKVSVIVEDVLVDVRKNHFLIGHAEDCHSNQADVTMLGLRFVVHVTVSVWINPVITRHTGRTLRRLTVVSIVVRIIVERVWLKQFGIQSKLGQLIFGYLFFCELGQVH